MDMEDESMLYNLGGACLTHGDEFIRECSMCGAEFCAKCFPGHAMCPDCAETVDEEDAGEDVIDADLIEDEEVESLLNEADKLPDEDLGDGFGLVDEEDDR